MNGLLASLASFLSSHLWLGPFVAFLAGVLTSFTPCSLSTVPLILGYVGSDREQTRSRAFRLSLGYAVALAVTNTALGVVASLLGHMVLGGRWGRLFLAVLLVVMALQTWGVVNVIPSSYLTSKHKQKGLPGAFLAGVLASLFSIPCTTPFLVSLLALVADKGSLYWGALLLLCYGLGQGVLPIILGTSAGWLKALKKSPRYGALATALNALLGLVVFAFSLYLFWGVI